MATVLNVSEYTREGFAVIEDTQGKYIASKHSDKIQEIPKITYPFRVPNLCALLQPRERMLT